MIHKDKIKSNLVTYLHACCLFPVMSTFELSIQKGYFSSWPGLTSTVVKRHLPTSIHTAEGHLRQEQKNLQSANSKDKLRQIKEYLTSLETQHPVVPIDTAIKVNTHQDYFPPPDNLNHRFNCVLYNIFLLILLALDIMISLVDSLIVQAVVMNTFCRLSLWYKYYSCNWNSKLSVP